MEFGTPTAIAVIHQAPNGRDSDGNDRQTVTSVQLVWGAFDPGGSAEGNQDQQRVTTQPSVFVNDAALAVDADDQVVVGPDIDGAQLVLDAGGLPVGGQWFEVDGWPAVWRDPFDGWAPGTVVRLRQVTG